MADREDTDIEIQARAYSDGGFAIAYAILMLTEAVRQHAEVVTQQTEAVERAAEALGRYERARPTQ